MSDARIRRKSVYCDRFCANRHKKSLNPNKGMASGHVGAMNEMKTCCDLIKRGFEVFRSVSPANGVDLVIIDENKKTLRVEVTTGRYLPSGAITYTTHDNEKYDIIAVVTDKEIKYIPDL